jgi:hypothetical protein
VLKVSKVTGLRNEGVLFADIALAEVEARDRLRLAAVFSSAWNAGPVGVGFFFHFAPSFILFGA